MVSANAVLKDKMMQYAADMHKMIIEFEKTCLMRIRTDLSVPLFTHCLDSIIPLLAKSKIPRL